MPESTPHFKVKKNATEKISKLSLLRASKSSKSRSKSPGWICPLSDCLRPLRHQTEIEPSRAWLQRWNKKLSSKSDGTMQKITVEKIWWMVRLTVRLYASELLIYEPWRALFLQWNNFLCPTFFAVFAVKCLKWLAGTIYLKEKDISILFPFTLFRENLLTSVLDHLFIADDVNNTCVHFCTTSYRT